MAWTRPAYWARSGWCIFMASTTASGAPAETSCPTATSTATTVPAIGERTDRSSSTYRIKSVAAAQPKGQVRPPSTGRDADAHDGKRGERRAVRKNGEGRGLRGRPGPKRWQHAKGAQPVWHRQGRVLQRRGDVRAGAPDAHPHHHQPELRREPHHRGDPVREHH